MGPDSSLTAAMMDGLIDGSQLHLLTTHAMQFLV